MDASVGGIHIFRDFVSKNIGVGQSYHLAPRIHQNTESLIFPIGQNNLNGKFGLNLTSHDMPLHDPRRNESRRSVKGVPEVFFLQRGLLWALLPAILRVRRSFSPFITLAATTTLIGPTTLTATGGLMATATLMFTTFRLTPYGPMGIMAWRTWFTCPKGAIGDTRINMVVHICLFTLFPMFGTQNPMGRWRFRPGVGGFLRRGFRMTHCVHGGVSGFGGVRVRCSIRIHRIHRSFIARRAMGVGHRPLVSSIATIESFPLRNVFMGQGVDILELQARPTLLHFHSVAACVRCVIELQDPFL